MIKGETAQKANEIQKSRNPLLVADNFTQQRNPPDISKQAFAVQTLYRLNNTIILTLPLARQLSLTHAKSVHDVGQLKQPLARPTRVPP